MSNSQSETVECPRCGEAFDPTAAGGWCTNSDCGEWRYEGAVREVADGGSTADDADPDPDADPEPTASDARNDDSHDADVANTSDPAAAANDGADADADADADAEAEAESDEQLVCPSCGEPIAAADNYCGNCGEDVSALEPGPLEACPECGADVDAADNFCVNCGENLEPYRPAPDAEPGRASVASAGTDDGGAGAAERPIEDSLKLVVRNHEIRVWDGDTVGRKIRGVVIETGGDEEDAVRIHREHVRFRREGDQFYVKALGQNPTVVNGDPLAQGERVPIEPDDRIELSGVAKIRVEAP